MDNKILDKSLQGLNENSDQLENLTDTLINKIHNLGTLEKIVIIRELNKLDKMQEKLNKLSKTVGA